MTIFIAITGASGASYAARAFEILGQHEVDLWATITPTAAQIARHELQIEPHDLAKPSTPVTWFAFDDLTALPASGSTCPDAMLILPCSMGTLGRIASGLADTLITRGADVCLKERKPLVLVPRETPLNAIQLRNMMTLNEAGATILPACPHFYHQPTNLTDLLDSVVGRALVHLGLPDVEQPRWSPTGTV